ncbi:MAG: RloB domain-containing protein [Microcystis panniformis Mp_MB_F_20051200_S9]|uniref:RloB domain-containing protein n=1 Tax=Microcystis panniformis Mp_MB_F_20051200_S9 TaxID=2486223 RepID=A0A552PYC7_9CHRO|nr:MAG: RloB domain-containing protein [Microcystis panniformis Mp_GB_SS_20050300_S99]TRV43401.1 MAG: RloB domain-containing protein [Microcystis panniformis Mp_GB_SS_20050300_S99D]TRV48656.1 MAG: RloB domain-containing protein [Microcystis panniformis Mp_MB_F_20080800_S26D]TRV54219.1 MAG: RloB domain-containing protein [Microcystis panniformis Mp_MB_F_20080800_S26]TRV61987.1 MAG: RloB domain-containing protein [Microcystis panniformis Mp_MB_F_20051200_S9]TRV69260.1 MAG: RloB domain-containing
MAKKDGNYSYLKRQANKRQPRETFLIVCEGEKTEYYYFTCLREDLKSNNIKIKVKGEGQNTLSLVKKAINIKNNEKSASYDQVWCVFDKDNYTKEQFNQAEGLAQEENIKIAYSNEAFEIWYILHFQYLDTATPRDRYGSILTNQMRKLGLVGEKEKYEKTRENIYEKLKPYQPKAIINAEKLIKRRDELKQHPFDPHLSTTVHELVRELNKNSRS